VKEGFREHLKAMMRIFEYKEEKVWGHGRKLHKGLTLFILYEHEVCIKGIFHNFYSSLNIINLLTYLLHGAQSFLRS
jgi:hypothetical protein